MSRTYQFTLNEVNRLSELTGYLSSLKNLVFGYAAIEFAPSTGHAHVHGWVKFSTTTRLSLARCAGAHVEGCKANAIKNLQYVTLEGSVVWEYGDVSKLGIKGLENGNVKTIDELIKEHKIEDVKGADLVYWWHHKGSNSDMAVKCYKMINKYYKKEDIGEWNFDDPILKLPKTMILIARNFSKDKCCKAVWEYLVNNYKEVHFIIDHMRDIPNNIFIMDQWEWEEPLQRHKIWEGIPDESESSED